jgi:hypothetical protein
MSENLPPSAVRFHYIKGNLFRVIHADGAIGGITSSRGIFLSLFSERGAIPRIVKQAVNADGSLGGEISRTGKDGLVREVEIGVMLNEHSATEIANWLLKQAAILAASKPLSASEKSANFMEEIS